MNISRSGERALSEALSRSAFRLGEVPDVAHEEVEDALRSDEATVQLAEAVGALDTAEDVLSREVAQTRRIDDEDVEVDEDLRTRSSDALVVHDAARDLLDDRVADVASEAVRVEVAGYTADLRGAIHMPCPTCRADESATLDRRSWFGFVGAHNDVAVWVCLHDGTLVEDRTDDVRVSEAPEARVDEGLDLTDLWVEARSEEAQSDEEGSA